MFSFLKRALPFTLTLIIGVTLGTLFNLFSASPQTQPRVLRYEGSYTTGGGSGSGCRSRRRSYYEDNRSARIISQAQPTYTAEARRNQTEGDVTLRVTLGADGTVTEIKTVTTLPYGLTEQAIRAARLIKFVPATRGGSPIDEMRTITYSFNLN